MSDPSGVVGDTKDVKRVLDGARERSSSQLFSLEGDAKMKWIQFDLRKQHQIVEILITLHYPKYQFPNQLPLTAQADLEGLNNGSGEKLRSSKMPGCCFVSFHFWC